MKVAIIHDWLTNYGGAETFVELLLSIYSEAEIFTLVYDRKKMKGHFENCKIHTSFVQKIPFASKLYTKFLTLMPRAFESFDLSSYDLVISSSSSCAKGVIVPPYIPHIAYIHSPMRYAWDLFFDYKKRSGKITKFFMDQMMPSIRLWDYVSSQRVDTLIANSKYIARRIKKFWNREAEVIYSPLNTERFYPDSNLKREDFYVAFSRLVPYKRIDLAIKAIKNTGKKLVIIGSGSEEKKLKELAHGDKNIIFLGRASDDVLRKNLQTCKAMIFCAEEDFGLAPLEAQACGSPVIAFGRGGATETVVDGITGVFFEEQTEVSLKNAITRFENLYEKKSFTQENIINQALSFNRERFVKEFTETVERTKKNIKEQYQV